MDNGEWEGVERGEENAVESGGVEGSGVEWSGVEWSGLGQRRKWSGKLSVESRVRRLKRK